jgi:hypothetical protein
MGNQRSAGVHDGTGRAESIAHEPQREDEVRVTVSERPDAVTLRWWDRLVATAARSDVAQLSAWAGCDDTRLYPDLGSPRVRRRGQAALPPPPANAQLAAVRATLRPVHAAAPPTEAQVRARRAQPAWTSPFRLHAVRAVLLASHPAAQRGEPERRFLDVGSGMGRVVQAAMSYPFRRVLGGELSTYLHEIAVANLAVKKARLRCQHVDHRSLVGLQFHAPVRRPAAAPSAGQRRRVTPHPLRRDITSSERAQR